MCLAVINTFVAFDCNIRKVSRNNRKVLFDSSLVIALADNCHSRCSYNNVIFKRNRIISSCRQPFNAEVRSDFITCINVCLFQVIHSHIVNSLLCNNNIRRTCDCIKIVFNNFVVNSDFTGIFQSNRSGSIFAILLCRISHCSSTGNSCKCQPVCLSIISSAVTVNCNSSHICRSDFETLFNNTLVVTCTCNRYSCCSYINIAAVLYSICSSCCQTVNGNCRSDCTACINIAVFDSADRHIFNALFMDDDMGHTGQIIVVRSGNIVVNRIVTYIGKHRFLYSIVAVFRHGIFDHRIRSSSGYSDSMSFTIIDSFITCNCNTFQVMRHDSKVLFNSSHVVANTCNRYSCCSYMKVVFICNFKISACCQTADADFRFDIITCINIAVCNSTYSHAFDADRCNFESLFNSSCVVTLSCKCYRSSPRINIVIKRVYKISSCNQAR